MSGLPDDFKDVVGITREELSFALSWGVAALQYEDFIDMQYEDTKDPGNPGEDADKALTILQDLMERLDYEIDYVRAEHKPEPYNETIAKYAPTATAPTLTPTPRDERDPLDRIELRVAADDVKTDLEVVCTDCGIVLCDAEHGDSVRVLASVAAAHVCGLTPEEALAETARPRTLAWSRDEEQGPQAQP